MRKNGYLVVEGPHDVEFIYRLLSPFNMNRIQHENELDSFLEPLIPRQYPPKGDLQKRMPTPLFLQSETHSIAIHSATGDSQLINVMEENAAILDLNAIVGIGILLDSDKEIPAIQRYDNFKNNSSQFTLPSMPGEIAKGSPNLGAFVLPDNKNIGTLEDLLLECANSVYPELLGLAKNYVDNVERTKFDKTELKDIKKPAGKNKAIIGAMANIMKPGKAVQVSIQDNNWLKGNALHLPRIQQVQQFLQDLFEL